MPKFPGFIDEQGVLLVNNGNRTLLGYLMEFEGRGIFEPNYGKMPDTLTSEMAKRHNELLDDMLIKGLDEHCQVGQCGTFYLRQLPHTLEVRTFLGKTVFTDIAARTKTTVTFRRNGKLFCGKTIRKDELFNFERIA